MVHTSRVVNDTHPPRTCCRPCAFEVNALNERGTYWRIKPSHSRRPLKMRTASLLELHPLVLGKLAWKWLGKVCRSVYQGKLISMHARVWD